MTCKMNHIGREKLFFGSWSAPRLGRNKRFFRSPLQPDSGIHFEVIKLEPYVIEVDLFEEIPSLKIQVNEALFPVKGRRFRRLVSADKVRIGSNRLIFHFSETDCVAVQEINIYPKRFQKLKNRFSSELDFLTPVKFHYFLNPREDAHLELSYRFAGKGPVQGNIRILYENGERTFSQSIVNGKTIRISMLDKTFHHIEVDIPETRSQNIRLEKSQLIEAGVENLESPRLREIANGKNILLILLDAARADHMSCYGYHRETTPNIDVLSSNGFRFTDMFSEAAYTLASTGTLLTGLPPDFHGVVSAFYSSLREGIVTFPELLRKKGYVTAAISSNPFFGKAYNYHKGFDRFVELYQESEVVGAEDFIVPFEKFVAGIKQKPFYLYMHLREPHAPYMMPEPYFGKYQKRFEAPTKAFHEEIDRILTENDRSPADIELINDVYDENLACADSVVGKFLEILKEARLSENTITIIIADHGEGLGEHGLVGHNVVLHEEGIHIPLILHIPGSHPGFRVIEKPALTSDLVVTLCDLLEISYPYAGLTQGLNLFHLPEKRTRICRSTVMSSNYSGYVVDSFPFRAIIFPDMGGLDIQVYEIDKDPGVLDVLSGNTLPGTALEHFLSRFLEKASMGFQTGDKPKLSIEERERLKALGYIQDQ
ncbi:MAG: sulfatase [Candidatus Aminicenantes bacterium]|nr:sulfatase [Candidatus Aminicenantes bacterium]